MRHAANAGINIQYVVGTSPAAYNVTGIRNFCANEDAVLHQNVGAPRAAFPLPLAAPVLLGRFCKRVS